MPVKSYVPQLVRMLRRACIYVTKHQDSMTPYLTTQQAAALTSVTSACQAFFGTLINEEP